MPRDPKDSEISRCPWGKFETLPKGSKTGNPKEIQKTKGIGVPGLGGQRNSKTRIGIPRDPKTFEAMWCLIASDPQGTYFKFGYLDASTISWMHILIVMGFHGAKRVGIFSNIFLPFLIPSAFPQNQSGLVGIKCLASKYWGFLRAKRVGLASKIVLSFWSWTCPLKINRALWVSKVWLQSIGVSQGIKKYRTISDYCIFLPFWS